VKAPLHKRRRPRQLVVYRRFCAPECAELLSWHMFFEAVFIGVFVAGPCLSKSGDDRARASPDGSNRNQSHAT
jgi:hypothetical protein